MKVFFLARIYNQGDADGETISLWTFACDYRQFLSSLNGAIYLEQKRFKTVTRDDNVFKGNEHLEE